MFLYKAGHQKISGGFDMKKGANKSLQLVFILLLTLLSACVSSTSSNSLNTVKEIWKGSLAGDIRGEMVLILDQTETTGDQRDILGKITIKYDYAKGGHDSGTMIGRIRGSQKNGRLDAKINGSVLSATFMGDIKGDMTEKNGRGSFSIYVPDETAGTFIGDWNLEKQ